MTKKRYKKLMRAYYTRQYVAGNLHPKAFNMLINIPAPALSIIREYIVKSMKIKEYLNNDR